MRSTQPTDSTLMDC